MIFYEPARRDRDLLPHDPLKALIAPRPIGWISSVAADGAVNLAPYSFANMICERPPMVAFSSSGRKHAATFAGERGAFVWNVATWPLRDQMVQTSAVLERGHSEFEHAGLEMAPSRLVDVPRVAAASAAFECRVVADQRLVDVDGNATDQYLVIGQVVGVHLDESLVRDGRLDTTALRPVARCGYRDYAVVTELFEMSVRG